MEDTLESSLKLATRILDLLQKEIKTEPEVLYGALLILTISTITRLARLDLNIDNQSRLINAANNAIKNELETMLKEIRESN